MQKKKLRNPRLKEQSYCGEPPCQRARKTDWERNRCKSNPKYKTQRQKSQERWRKKRPADQYQSNYRDSHSDYVKDNREKQLTRNKKLSQKRSEKKIVKMDTLNHESPVYVMNCFKQDASTKKIVKMDTLFVQFTAAEGELPIQVP